MKILARPNCPTNHHLSLGNILSHYVHFIGQQQDHDMKLSKLPTSCSLQLLLVSNYPIDVKFIFKIIKFIFFRELLNTFI